MRENNKKHEPLSASQYEMIQALKIHYVLPCTSINMNTAKSLIKKGVCKFDDTNAAIVLTQPFNH